MLGDKFIQHGDLLDQLNSAHVGAVAQWDKMKEAQQQLDMLRENLDGLVALGDTVSGDDVLKAATRLVAGGQSASAMAGLLADMPQDGPSLQGWILDQDKKIEQQEGQVAQMGKLAQHQVATTGLQVIHAYQHLGEAAAPVAAGTVGLNAGNAPAAPAANPLTAGAA